MDSHTADVRTIAVQTHGRYLVREAPDACGVLVGLHGYAETAEQQLERLAACAGDQPWTLLSIQGLHRFYRGRWAHVVASWMTRQDRDLAVVDNLAYIDRVLDIVLAEVPRRLVYAGFSQGVSMAFRAACAGSRRATAVIALGGDIPPELDAGALARVPAVLLGRGVRDDLYAAETLARDAERLRVAGCAVEQAELDAGHEWTADFSRAAAVLLRRR